MKQWFNNKSIGVKNLSFLIILLAFSGINYITIQYYRSLEKTDAVIIDIAGRNRMLSQRIGLLSEMAVNGKADVIPELKKAISLHDSSLYVLKNGGLAPKVSQNIRIPAAPQNILPIIGESEKLWIEYKNNADFICNHPISEIKEIQLIDSSYLKDTIVFGNIRVALTFLEKNAQELLKRNNDIVTAFVELNKSKQNTLNLVLIVLLFINILIVYWGAYFFKKNITHPLQTIISIAERMTHGDTSDTIRYQHKDELGKISEAINQLSGKIKSIGNYVAEISKGNYQQAFETSGDHDILGKELNQMREHFIKADQEETLRKEEDAKRNWATTGFAKFGDILRQNNDNIEKLSFNIIKNIVEYIKANQGGVFIVNDTDSNNRHLEMTACYAYNRQKFFNKTVDPKEGLIGACFMEKNIIHLTEIPENYLQISSGLGDSNPRSLILVPLKLNNEVYGVIEIASFNKFESYQIDFLSNIAESIASTISSAKINQRTAELLQISQQQSEEMRAQEEEMRQNMEEMQATQEEMGRKEYKMQEMLQQMKKNEDEMQMNISNMKALQSDMENNQKNLDTAHKKINSIINGTQDAIFTLHNNLTFDTFNRACIDLFGYSENEIKSMSISEIFKFLKIDKIEFGKKMRQKMLRKDKTTLMCEVIVTEINGENNEKSLLFFARDVSKEIAQEKELIAALGNAERQRDDLSLQIKKLEEQLKEK